MMMLLSCSNLQPTKLSVRVSLGVLLYLSSHGVVSATHINAATVGVVQAADTLQRRKRKRYFEADAADAAGAAEAVARASVADEGMAALEAAAADGDDASYHTDSGNSDSEYEEDGLAWGDYLEV